MSAKLPEGIHTVEVVVGDNYGILRGKRVPVSMWEHVVSDGVAIANAIFVWSPRCDVRDDAPYGNWNNGYPDVRLVPLPDTLRPVPWRPGNAMVLCEAREEDGSLVHVDPRNALKRVLDQCADAGYEPLVGIELEFFLLDPTTRLPREEDIQCYGVARGSAYEPVAMAIRNMLIEFGIPIEASNNEYAPGQFEVNIRYGDTLTSADNAILFRNSVREIAADHGYLASFMAKPFTEHSGNGFHLHQSLWRDGQNVFSDNGQLSDVGRWYLGGLRAHMGELTLLGTPTPNGMKRRVPYSFCPTNDAWGIDNRTVGLRAILGHEGHDSAVRIEQRDGSADCNPYLLVAGQIAAGLRGISERIEPGPMCEGDAYVDQTAERLPTTIPEAIDLLQGSQLVKETLGETLVELIVGAARYENDLLTGMVGDVERIRYLDAF